MSAGELSAGRVSVVIATRGEDAAAHRWVRRAVESAVERAGETEVIVAAGAAEAPRLRRKLRGRAAVVGMDIDRGRLNATAVLRNAAAEAASGSGLVFLSEGELLAPGAIDLLQSALGEDDRCAHAYGWVRQTDGSVWRTPRWDPDDPSILGVTNPLPGMGLTRRERFEAIGGYDESLGAAEGAGGALADWFLSWDLWLRLVGQGWAFKGIQRIVLEGANAALGEDADGLHGRLAREVARKHAAFFDRHGMASLVRGNVMLRRSDANWIDETGYPIPHQVLYRVQDEYEGMTAVRLQRAVQRVCRAIRR